ncbi:MAG: 2-C-methyl-D-erythritol 4-phosphate cytidylyltransferase [Acidobacteria bacterium]|nr:2-C-methyl-D-erythritol 4-phosphate cytidylyltransferase [Acidobacteriota bacterium]
MHVAAIIAAGGRGTRVGFGRPKQLLEIGGKTLLERSLDAFARCARVQDIVVVLPPELVSRPPAYLKSVEKPIRVVAGGARRQDSVANGFRAVGPDADLIVIHDAARPLVSDAVITRTIEAGWQFGAAIAAIPASETVKQVLASPWADEPRPVARTLPREQIYLAQTPQAFRRDILRDALALAAQGVDATDEAMLAERAGHQVRLVDGEASNIKITTPEDLWLADAILRRGGALPAGTAGVGTGYDLHRLVPGRPLVLGGVTIPSDRGALGHSDADVVCHAAIDAILGAVGLGDIGRHFPDSDERWRAASSLDLLGRAAALVAEHGCEVGNVDVTVILEAPKIRDRIDAMRQAVAAALGIEIACVSIKGKTNEGVDAIGRGEAVAAHAVALVRRRG